MNFERKLNGVLSLTYLALVLCLVMPFMLILVLDTTFTFNKFNLNFVYRQIVELIVLSIFAGFITSFALYNKICRISTEELKRDILENNGLKTIFKIAQYEVMVSIFYSLLLLIILLNKQLLYYGFTDIFQIFFTFCAIFVPLFIFGSLVFRTILLHKIRGTT
ncbi:MAG: hypothetical protein ABGW92_03710 [Methanocaldococcus sp.]